MKRKGMLKALLTALWILLLWIPKEYVRAADDAENINAPVRTEEQRLPALIQATTFAGDYHARTDLGLTATRRQKTENLEEAFQKILCSCVRVQVEGHYGSGSIYRLLENEIIIVTNRHVLQYWEDESYITFWNGMTGSGKLIGMAENADVGFVSVPISRFTYEELLELRNIRIDPEKTFPARGTAVLLVDLATDQWNPVMHKGRIIDPQAYLQDFGMEMLYGSGQARGGMSGSGVFDGYGNYWGMLTGGTLNDEIAAVPIEMIEECFQTITSKD